MILDMLKNSSWEAPPAIHAIYVSAAAASDASVAGASIEGLDPKRSAGRRFQGPSRHIALPNISECTHRAIRAMSLATAGDVESLWLFQERRCEAFRMCTGTKLEEPATTHPDPYVAGWRFAQC